MKKPFIFLGVIATLTVSSLDSAAFRRLALARQENAWKIPSPKNTQFSKASFWAQANFTHSFRDNRPQEVRLLRVSAGICTYVFGCFSSVWLLAIPWTVARQVPLSMGFSRQEYLLEWSAISSSRGSSQPGDRTHISCGSCTAGRFFTTEPWGKPQNVVQPHPKCWMWKGGLQLQVNWHTG